jgi:hypothetical protein
MVKYIEMTVSENNITVIHSTGRLSKTSTRTFLESFLINEKVVGSGSRTGGEGCPTEG